MEYDTLFGFKIQSQRVAKTLTFVYNLAMSTDCKTIKESLEQRELEILSPYATKCLNSKAAKDQETNILR